MILKEGKEAVGWAGCGLARRWGRGRVGWARRGPDSQELKSGVHGEELPQRAVARFGWGRVSCEKRALGDFERGKGGGRVGGVWASPAVGQRQSLNNLLIIS